MTRAEALAYIAGEQARITAADAPDRWFCDRCQVHRANRVGGLCPVCQDDERPH